MAVSVIKAIKTYFEDDSDGFGRKVELAELKALTAKDRDDMVELLAAVGIKAERTVAQ